MTKRRKDFKQWLCEQQGVLPQSALRYMLEALLPYTEANVALVFRPSVFFRHLDQLDDDRRYGHETLRKAYYEAKRRGLVVMNDDGSIDIDDSVRSQLKPYEPRQLKGAGVMVVFDVPIAENNKRRWFRLLLKELKFVQIQQSVWMSDYECSEALSAGILDLRLENHVRIFEARPIEMLPS